MGDEELRRTAATVVIRDEHGEHVAIQRIRLTSLGPEGVAFEASGDRVTLGSHDRCDVVLRDRTVSRWHCEIQIRSAEIAIVDLGSSNGTTVNGVRVERAFVERGAILGLGHVKLRFDIAIEPVRLPVSPATRFGRLVGEAPESRAMFAVLERAAASDATVLLTGETGTGKELAAHSLHEASPRAAKPFVVVDCASIPGELLETELFGHARGAFTGAVSDRTGAFEAAHGGTIFLDEIGELPISLQPKLLRALESREVKPVGEQSYRAVDVRVIAATHRDLPHEIAAGRFRSDLYYRLAVIEVRMPALRDRLTDLPHVIGALLDDLGATPDERTRIASPESLGELARHAWPGNIRELRNHVERVLALGTAPVSRTAAAPETAFDAKFDLGLPLREARDKWNRELERRYVTALLDAHGGNVSAAARAAGVDRSHLHRLIARLRV